MLYILPMRKIISIGIVAISMSSSHGFAENMAGKIRKAIERSTLNQSGTKPFHLKSYDCSEFRARQR
jgi:hypothetical protein